MNPASLQANRSQSAAALMVILAAIILLSLSIVAVVEMTDHGASESLRAAQEFKARQIAESGLALGTHPDVVSTDAALHQDLENGAYRLDVFVTSEQGRIYLNNATEQTFIDGLRELFILWGLDAQEAAVAAESLADWIDTNDVARTSGAESDYYSSLQYENYPRNSPFASLDEALLVRGMDAVARLKPDWRNFFTLYGDGRIDINSAPSEVIQAFAGLQANDAERFVEARNGPDGILGTEDDSLYTGGNGGNANEAVDLLGISPEDIQGLSEFMSLETSVIRIESRAIVGDLVYSMIAIVDSESGDQLARAGSVR